MNSNDEQNFVIIPNIVGGETQPLLDKRIIRSPFEQYNDKLSVEFPQTDIFSAMLAVDSAKRAFADCQEFNLEQRARTLFDAADSLDLEPAIPAMSMLLGYSVHTMRLKVQETKDLMKKIAVKTMEQYNGKTPKIASNRIVYNIVPYNEIAEWAFFIANAVMAGIPTILRSSDRNPIPGSLIAKAVSEKGYPGISVLHFSTNTRINQYLLDNTNLQMGMGSRSTAETLGMTASRKIFYADHSRIIVDDTADLEEVTLGMQHMLISPLSCLFGHLIYFVDSSSSKKRTKDFIIRLNNMIIDMNKYRGDLLNPQAQLGLLSDEQSLRIYQKLLATEWTLGNLDLISPNWDDLYQDRSSPVLAQVYYGPNSKLVTSATPFYFLSIKTVNSIQEATLHSNEASLNIQNKSMTGSLYTNTAKIGTRNGKVYVLNGGLELSWEILDPHLNEDPTMHSGIQHGGFNIPEWLIQP